MEQGFDRAAWLERIKRTILEVEPSATVLLYGSRARGDARPDSDWDFLVLLDGPVSRQRKFRLRSHVYLNVEMESGEVISTVIRQRDQWLTEPWSPFRESVLEEGVEL